MAVGTDRVALLMPPIDIEPEAKAEAEAEAVVAADEPAAPDEVMLNCPEDACTTREKSRD
jgi:hypothetical protein